MKLIYTDKNNKTIEFSATSKCILQKVDIGGTDAVSQTVKSPYQDGESGVGDSYFKSKLIKIDFTVLSDTLDADIRTLYNVLNPKTGMATLTVINNDQYYVYDKVKTKTLPSRLGNKSRGPNFQVTSIILEAYDPYLKDYNSTEIQAISGASTFSFPVGITDTFSFGFFNVDGFVLENKGDVECPLEIVIDGPQTAPLEITNGDEKIVITTNISADESLKITTELENINVVKTTISTGVQESAFQYIDVDQTEFFQLAIGENNIVITANATDVASALLKFRNKYVGV
jgi:hypothetical protein